jgi:hypothetical protein
MFLDRTFDRDDERRRLLRIHELGHALGYLHVGSRLSIMNPAIGPEPTTFDRQGATIAFQRMPGNVPPDSDPTAIAGPGGGYSLRWAAPVACTATMNRLRSSASSAVRAALTARRSPHAPRAARTSGSCR